MQRVAEIAREKHCTSAQLALAWVLAQGEHIVPIPGTKRRKYLQENVGALDVSLTSEDLARINELSPKGVAAGSRYPEAMMKLVVWRENLRYELLICGSIWIHLALDKISAAFDDERAGS